MNKNDLTLTKLFVIPSDAAARLEGKTFVGIDFGTSTTVVSVASYDDVTGMINSVSLQIGQKTADGVEMTGELVPSVIALNEDNGKLLVGEGAYQLKGNPDYSLGDNIWHSFKMELGKDIGPKWYNSSHPRIKSPLDATKIFFTFLKRGLIKACEEEGISTNIQYAVSIPASFESNQRKDLIEALKYNGIHTSENALIDEPNAAFLAYTNPDLLNRKPPIVIKDDYSPKVLVLDFGAGTCDISLLEISVGPSGMRTKNISISQFEELGGNDMDRYIAWNYLLPELFRQNNAASYRYTKAQKQSIVDQLMGVAENLKIQIASDGLDFLLSDESSMEIALSNNHKKSYKAHIEIYTEYEMLTTDELSLSYKQFLKCMRAFMHEDKSTHATRIEGQEPYNSIYSSITSALEKAEVDADEVDYVMMIGGSSKNPFVQRSIQQYLPTATMLIPQDLQSLVSQGAAIQSLLLNGLGITAIRPITSEPIYVITRDERAKLVVPAGHVTPFAPIEINWLSTGDRDLERIDVPICVSSIDKVLNVITLTNPSGDTFPRNATVTLSIELNADKILITKVTCGGIECSVTTSNPFINGKQTKAGRKIHEAQKEIYTSTEKNGGKPTKDAFAKLVAAYRDADLEMDAAETLIEQKKHYPQSCTYNYIGVCYHNAGRYEEAIYNFRLALEEDSDTVWPNANLGHTLYLRGLNSQAKQYLEKAISLDPANTTALIVLGRIYRDEEDDEKFKEYSEQAYNILIRQFNDGKLSTVDYTWLPSLAEDLGKTDVAEKVRQNAPKKENAKLYNKEDLAEATGEGSKL